MTRVLLHGFTGAPASWSTVRATLRRPEPETHTLALLGHDGTSPPVEAERGDRFAPWWSEIDRLDGVLAAREVSSAHLIGYSLGARVALGLLARHPRRFARATLIGLHPGLPDEREREERAAADVRWATLLARSIDEFVQAWEAQPLFASQFSVAGERERERQRAIRLAHHPAGLARALRDLGLAAMPDLRGALPALSIFVDVVVGEGDARFLAIAREATSALPRARLRIIPGCGHNPLVERGAALATILEEEP